MAEITSGGLRKLKNFKKRKTAFYSFILLVCLVLSSLAAELIANNKPYITFYKGGVYFPLFVHYPTAKFDYFSIRPDYRKICKRENTTCIFPPVKYDPIEIIREVESYPSPPSLEHPMGLDSIGRDIFARMLYGFRVSISYAAGVWLVAFTFGTIIGCLMGFYGGIFDITFYRLMEIFFAIPYLIVLITLVSIFTPNIILLIFISSLFSWGYLTRYMRSQVFKIRKLDYIMSARASGCTTRQILFKHILPNALTPIITFSPFFIAANILGLSSLDFLGLGVMPPTPSWGELLRQGKEYFLEAWYLAVFPSLGLFVTLALINFVGEGIRDAFDPRKY
ncbi:MAG: ABC transporter permease subunit [Bacteriovoracaceae bacterium]|nr:ABC transporter permease subunit [Bacteriovoracaceae bacterium]